MTISDKIRIYELSRDLNLENKDVLDAAQKLSISVKSHSSSISAEEAKKIKNVKWLAQGTIYPDVIESISVNGGPSSTIKSHHNVGGLPKKMNLKILEPIKLLFKDEVRNIGKSLNMVLPTKANTSTQSEKLTALWLSPDEWMIFSNGVVKENTNSYETETLLNKKISKLNLGAVVDVTDQFVRINLKGDKIYDLFQTGSPFNFNDFKSKIGSVTQTILAKIDVIIHNQNKNEVNLFVRRSFSEHLFAWMNDSASRL